MSDEEANRRIDEWLAKNSHYAQNQRHADDEFGSDSGISIWHIIGAGVACLIALYFVFTKISCQ